MTTPDLSNCAREPIHIPGAIQPHGVLFALKEPELIVRHVSANTADIVGVEAENLLGKSILDYIARDSGKRLTVALSAPELRAQNPIRIGWGDRGFDGIVHRNRDGILILELESGSEETSVEFLPFFHTVRRATERMSGAATTEEANRIAAEEVRRITGFGRVMVYRFDDDWHGIVEAEDRDPGMASYMGLRFPATDIPEQARKLYALNWLRLIADRDYTPAPIWPPTDPDNGNPLDLSFSVLRSVSPVHLEYLKNMGDCGASMSISVMRGDRLWGLIALHHREARYVPYQVRSACEFIGRMLSQQLGTIQTREEDEQRRRGKASFEQLVRSISARRNPLDAVARTEKELLALAGATGAAFCFRKKLTLIGQTPTEKQVVALVDWLDAHHLHDVYSTDRLPELYEPAREFAERGSGILAVSTSREHDTYVVWFRPEVIKTIGWAGNPEKPVAETPAGELRIHPRRSFEIWKQTLRGRSAPWEGAAVDLANDFRGNLISEQLSAANLELETSNHELDAFAYVVSHDLKEPLRGIRSYVSFSLQDHGDSIIEPVKERLGQVVHLTKRMDELLESLHAYSQVGRVDYGRRAYDLNEIIERVRTSLQHVLDEKHAELRVPRPLPSQFCDGVRVGEVFLNLVANALKYNDKPLPWVEVGYRECVPGSGLPITFFVRDNGIGIAPKYFDLIFKFSKRLHGRDKFGGGSGAGLAIVKRIVELHRGKIGVTSTPGEGTEFWFTLAEEEK